LTFGHFQLMIFLFRFWFPWVKFNFHDESAQHEPGPRGTLTKTFRHLAVDIYMLDKKTIKVKMPFSADILFIIVLIMFFRSITTQLNLLSVIKSLFSCPFKFISLVYISKDLSQIFTFKLSCYGMDWKMNFSTYWITFLLTTLNLMS